MPLAASNRNARVVIAAETLWDTRPLLCLSVHGIYAHIYRQQWHSTCTDTTTCAGRLHKLLQCKKSPTRICCRYVLLQVCSSVIKSCTAACTKLRDVLDHNCITSCIERGGLLSCTVHARHTLCLTRLKQVHLTPAANTLCLCAAHQQQKHIHTRSVLFATASAVLWLACLLHCCMHMLYFTLPKNTNSG